MAGFEPANTGVKVWCLFHLATSLYEARRRGIRRAARLSGLSRRMEERRCPLSRVELLTGFEPALSAWKAEVLPLHHSST